MEKLIKKEGITRIVILIGNFAIKFPNVRNGQLNFLTGCLSNYRERLYCKTFKGVLNNYYYSLVAPSIYCSIFGLVQIQKRCIPLNRELSGDEIDKFREISRGDLKPENFGIFKNKVVCLDY